MKMIAKNKTTTKNQQQSQSPLVSVVITTKNEEVNIENCLKSIKQQSYPCKNIEIIVVDNNSTDKTKEITRRYTKLVFNKGPERSAQRNFGINRGKGTYALYLDADMTLSKEVIEECVNTCQLDNSITGLYIPEIIVGDSFWVKVRRFERKFYNGTVIDCVRFIPKNAFNKVKGFDLTMTGPEDWDFDKKIRNIGNVKVIKNEVSHNEGNFNMKKYLQKKRYYSQTFDSYINKWGREDPDIKKQLGISYRYFGVFTEDGKWMKLFAHPILTLGMYYLRFRVGMGFLVRGRRK